MSTPLSVISASKPNFNNKFGISRKKTIFSISPPSENVSDIEWLEKGIEDLIGYIKEDSVDNDKIGFTFSSPHFKGGDAFVAFKPAQNISAEDLLHVVGGLMQSGRDKDASWNGNMTIEVTRLRIPSISSISNSMNTTQLNNPHESSYVNSQQSTPLISSDYNLFKNYCKNKRSIVCINNTDNLSLPKAIVVSKAKLKNDPEYELIRKNKNNRQSLKAMKLLKKANLELRNKMFGPSELKLLQKQLRKYNLKVYQFKPEGNELIFDGINPGSQHDIRLIRCNGHYNAIVK